MSILRLNIQLLFGIAASVALNASSQATVLQTEINTPIPDGPRVIVEKGLNHRLWQNLKRETLPDGRVVTNKHEVTELGTGMYHLDSNGQLVESREVIELVDGGAAALHGQAKVKFLPDINTQGAIDLEDSEGKHLRSHVLGLAYTDTTTGQSILIAQVKSSIGELLAPNQIIYRGAFTDINADIVYTYKKGSFEQDIVLHESPAPPEDWNLVPETTSLEVFTEFIDAPAPGKRLQKLVLNWPNGADHGRALMDETLHFGRIVMPIGKAFSLGRNPERAKVGSALPVGKSWRIIDGRKFLIEALPYPSAKAKIDVLPRMAAIKKPGDRKASLAFAFRDVANMFPSRMAAKVASPSREAVRMASRAIDPKGFVIDYQAVVVNLDQDGSDGYRFEGDKTYHISDLVNLNNVVFEGGSVIKFATTNYTALQLYDSVQCLTDPYHPAIFTSQMDESVGESLYSPGAPTNCYVPISIALTNTVMQHIRVSYADYAFHAYGINLRHSQIVHCGSALFGDSGLVNADNVLIYDCNAAFSGQVYQGAATHLTIDHCNLLAEDLLDFSYSSIAFTNCLITDVADNGLVAFTTNRTTILGSGENVYQTVGAGSHYLATNSSQRNVGTTNIPSWLAVDLGTMTTYAPVALPPTLCTNALTLSPQVARDTDTPDIGYHYVPLDYAIGDLAVYTTNGVLTISPGTAIGAYQQSAYNYTLYLVNGGRIVCEGSPTKLNHLARYNMVQEQANTNWAANRGYTLFAYSDGFANPLGRFRFTDWSTPAIDNPHVFVYEASSVLSLSFVDNQFYGGQLYLFNANLGVTNSLFDRVSIAMSDSSRPFNAYFQNNLFFGGSTFIEHVDAGAWKFRDNLFHNTDVQFDADPVDGDYNAYLTNALQLSSMSTTHVQVLTNSSIAFQSGPFGNYYLPPALPLLNSGSCTAGSVGLYHYTTQTNQTKEANSTVDCSFHYVATATANLPIDSDSDGLPDYSEDADGNGTIQFGETDFLNADTDYDGRNDGQEIDDGTDPLDQMSVIPGLLGFWSFSEATLSGSSGQKPILCTNVNWIATNGNAFVEVATNLSAIVNYRCSESNGLANINLQNGTIRFWVNPNWTSVSLGGTGPESEARLIEIGSPSANALAGQWAICINSSGSTLTFCTQGDGVSTTHGSVSISWQAGAWHQVAVTYSPSNSAIFIDGQQGATGGGVEHYPSSTLRESDGFRLGSDQDGTQQFKGKIDTLETYNAPIAAAAITADYSEGDIFGPPVCRYPTYWTYDAPTTAIWCSDPEPAVIGENINFKVGVNVGWGIASRQKICYSEQGQTLGDPEYQPQAGEYRINWSTAQTPDPTYGFFLGNNSGLFTVSPTVAGVGVLNLSGFGYITQPPLPFLPPGVPGVGFSFIEGGGVSRKFLALPARRLGFWRFDNSWLGEDGQAPTQLQNVSIVPSWTKGAALIDSTSAAKLMYAAFESDGSPNVRRNKGTISFYYYTDQQPEIAKSAPGTFFEMQGEGLWRLEMNTQRNRLELFANASQPTVANVSLPIQGWLEPFEWHQIVITYSSAATKLYIDAQLAATGSGVEEIVGRVTSFTLGANANGQNQIKGKFNDLQTFNHVLDFTTIHQEFNDMLALDSDGDGIPDLDEDFYQTNPLDPDTDGDGVNDWSDEDPLDPNNRSFRHNYDTTDTTAPTIILQVPIKKTSP